VSGKTLNDRIEQEVRRRLKKTKGKRQRAGLLHRLGRHEEAAALESRLQRPNLLALIAPRFVPAGTHVAVEPGPERGRPEGEPS
jgi:hypothetical protein